MFYWVNTYDVPRVANQLPACLQKMYTLLELTTKSTMQFEVIQAWTRYNHEFNTIFPSIFGHQSSCTQGRRDGGAYPSNLRAKVGYPCFLFYFSFLLLLSVKTRHDSDRVDWRQRSNVRDLRLLLGLTNRSLIPPYLRGIHPSSLSQLS